MRILTLASIVLLFAACERNLPQVTENTYVHRQDMRQLVRQFSQKARASDASFVVLAQNGHEVILRSFCTDCSAQVDQAYLNAINGIGVDHLHYGYRTVDAPNSTAEFQEVSAFLKLYSDVSKPILVSDYCTTPAFVDDAYQLNQDAGNLAFAASSKDLNSIPIYPNNPIQVNSNNISSLNQARNFLRLSDPSAFTNKSAYLQALASTDYDVIIIDAFFNGELLSRSEINSLKAKANGGSRLVLARLNIGEAESSAYYWDSSWGSDSPEWVEGRISSGSGLYKIDYSDTEWHKILYTEADSYLDKLLSAGFDGVNLTGVDAFKRFE